jgi:hypothetical protein
MTAPSRGPSTPGHFKNVGEDGWVADRSNGFWAVPGMGSKVLCSSESAGQWLALLRRAKLFTVAFRVKSAVVMIARVRVPFAISRRDQDVNISLHRPPDSQREP